MALVEALVACTLLAVGVTALLQLFSGSAHVARDGAATTRASALAVQKVEELRALAFTVDAAGQAVTDRSSDTARSPESSRGGTGLTPSSALSLLRDTDGYVDYLDHAGAKVASPADAAFRRRWSVSACAGCGSEALVLEVVVRPLSQTDAAVTAVHRGPGEARLLLLRRRGLP